MIILNKKKTLKKPNKLTSIPTGAKLSRPEKKKAV